MRFRNQPEASAAPASAALSLPRTEAEIVHAATIAGLVIDPACMPGVIANMALLDRHAGIMLARDGDREA